MNVFDSRQPMHTYAPSPPRSQPPSPVISRKPLPETPSHGARRSASISSSAACPSCGHTFSPASSEEAQRMISDLQAQVKLLNSKAAAAVDRLADYEDQLHSLRAGQQQQGQGQIPNGNPTNPYPPFTTQQIISPPPPPPPNFQPAQSRLSSLRSLLGGGSSSSTATVGANRRNPSINSIEQTSPSKSILNTLTSASQPHLPVSNEPTLHSLQSTLATERSMRLQAETNLTQTQMELEELTAQLFGQANEMVAEERRARSKLEERVRILERREKEKGERLKKLEGRVERVERVRKIVG